MTRSTLFAFNEDERNQGQRHHPFAVSLDRCNGSGRNLDDLSSRICASNKAEDAYLNIFNMVTKKMRQTHISCNCNVNLMVKKVM